MDPDARSRLAGRVVMAKGILNGALGILHLVGTFTFEREKVDAIGGALTRDYLVWFYGVGLFIVFMASVDIACHTGVRAGVGSAWRVAVLCSAFNAILGLSGVLVFGVSPPVQLLVTGVIGLVALVAGRPCRRAEAGESLKAA